MTDTREHIKKKLFIKLYSESEAKRLVPGSERALDLVQNLRRDDIKKIYIIASSQSISRPYISLFQQQVPGVMIRDLVLEKISRQDIYAIKSIIDDINASVKTDQSCEIILFNENLAGIILACFHVNTGKNTDLSISQVRKIVPNVLLSGSDIAFINEFKDFIWETSTAAPGQYRPERERPPEPPAPPETAVTVREQEGGDVREIDRIRRFINEPEPAGMLSRFRIATKLIALVSLILVISLSLMIFIGTSFFRSESRSKVYSSNATIARLVGDRLQDEIASSLEKARDAAGISSIESSSGELAARVKEMLFREKGNFIFMGIACRDGDGLRFKKTFYNENYFNENQVTRDTLKGIHGNNAGYFTQSFDGKIIVRNVSPDAGTPVLGMSFPYRHRKGAVASVIVCYVPLERFMDATRIQGPVRTSMVNDRGDCIVDPERNRVLSRVNMAEVPIVKKMLLSTTSNGTLRFRGSDGQFQLGSYRKLDMFGLGVIVTAAEGTVLRGVYDVERRNFIVMAIILLAAVLGAFIFSKTISGPIDELKQLAAAAPQDILKLSAPDEGDEIFYLTRSFKEVLRSYLDARERPAGRDTAGGMTTGGAAARTPGPSREEIAQQFRTEGLKIQVTYDGPEVAMAWMGRGSLENPGELLNPYLEGIINSMRGRGLTCDFSSLETMNASIIRSIINFAHMLDENRIRARFIYNKTIDWQDASFEALSAAVQEMDTISLDGRILEKNMFILQ